MTATSVVVLPDSRGRCGLNGVHRYEGLKKADVLQMANYLKPHGAGLFGMVICRRGANEVGCQHTVREEWQEHRKLILILNDDDVEAMLVAKSEGRAPEDLVSQKIQQFRLSM